MEGIKGLGTWERTSVEILNIWWALIWPKTTIGDERAQSIRERKGEQCRLEVGQPVKLAQCLSHVSLCDGCLSSIT